MVKMRFLGVSAFEIESSGGMRILIDPYITGNPDCPIAADDIEKADLILVMEKGQLDWIVSRFPETRGRVFMATHWVGGDDIADPYRQSAAFFEQVYSQLDEGVRAWADRLQPSRGS